MSETIQKRIVFAISGKQRSGKDTVAMMLMEWVPDLCRAALADPLKAEYCAIHNVSFYDLEQNKHLHRQGLIDLSIAKRENNPFYYLDKLMEYKGNIIIPDVRRALEYNYIKKMEPQTIFLRIEAHPDDRAARGILTNEDDPTETELDNQLGLFDGVIFNSGTEADLRQKARMWFDGLALDRRLS